jgi:hypothetical protein
MPPSDLWRSIYDSPWHNPGFFWLCGALFFLGLGLKIGGFRGFLVVFGLEILADCTLTGGWTPIPPGVAGGTFASVLFVILGDLRYLFLAEALRGAGLGRAALLRAAGLSLLVPTTAFGFRLLLPAVFSPARPFFLLYELLFFALALGQSAAIRPADRDEARFFRALLAFELVQYGLWALADVALLAGFGAGNLLRLLPNAMYYAFFLPFVAWRAPRAWWRS